MNHSPAGVSSFIDVDRASTTPLHKQIYDAFREAILRGGLRPGDQILSSRDLASEVQVSRFPVVHAYSQLIAEGYFETRAGLGTFVSGSLPEQLMSVEQNDSSFPRAPRGARPLAARSELVPPFSGSPSLKGWGAFGVHQPAFDQFPFKVWSSLVERHSRNPSAKALHHIDPLGAERFRKAICEYLRSARAVKCDPGQVMIVSGSQQALDITTRVLLDPGNAVFVEHPGYNLVRAILVASGCRVIPVPVDAEGMVIEEAARSHRDVRAAFVTPSHQYPLGSTMSATRRLHLLNWAQSAGAWIIEDDYDSEYRYGSRPIASLQGLDVNARVIYVGTFSKVLLPSLRVGYIVIPPDLVERFTALRVSMDIFPPYLYQEVLTDFMEMGHFARHLRKMRQLYGERRAVLIETLRREFGNAIEVHGSEAGMHLAITLPEGMDDQALAAKAAAQRLWLWPLSPYYFHGTARNGFILGFGSTPVSQIPSAVQHLRSLIDIS